LTLISLAPLTSSTPCLSQTTSPRGSPDHTSHQQEGFLLTPDSVSRRHGSLPTANCPPSPQTCPKFERAASHFETPTNVLRTLSTAVLYPSALLADPTTPPAGANPCGPLHVTTDGRRSCPLFQRVAASRLRRKIRPRHATCFLTPRTKRAPLRRRAAPAGHRNDPLKFAKG
jgi:hypothetical protein